MWVTIEAPTRGVRRRTEPLAWGLAVVSVALVGTAAIAAMLGELRLADAVNNFVVTNGTIALSFSLCGLILAAQRPDNAIGWLFLAGGLGHAVTAAAFPLIVVGVAATWPMWVVRAVTTAGVYAWPWSISLFLPLALLLFPDGRPPSRRWRWLVWVAIATAPLFVVDLGAEPVSPVSGGPPGYLTIVDHDLLAPVWTVAELRVLLLFGVGVLALMVRYRRGSEHERGQLLWLILAMLVALGVLVPWSLLVTGPVLILLAIPLIGVAVTVAILRYQLLDIRLVLSRTVLYVLLTGGAVLTYVVLVALLELMLRREAGLGISVLMTVLIAVGFNPVRVRLQRLIDHAWHGDKVTNVGSAHPIRSTLARSGLPPDLILEAERYNFRYRLRALSVLLVYGVILNTVIAAGLLRVGLDQASSGQAEPVVIYAIISSGIAVLMTAPLLQFLARRNKSTHTIHLLLETITTLARWNEPRQKPDRRIHQRRRLYRNLRLARQQLRSNSWTLAGNLAVLSGRRRTERDWAPAAALGRWLCWASEDLSDTSRINNAMQACVDTIRHTLGPIPYGAPPLQHPPRQALILRPTRSEHVRGYAASLRTVLIALIPIITASIGLATKLIP
jgi:hypothetical protein